MADQAFRVEQIDHVELVVSDQYKAAQWYADVLGLSIMKEVEFWAEDGPLMISSDGGSTKLALFQGEARDPSAGGIKRVAFRVSGGEFLRFLDHLITLEVTDRAGRRVTAGDVVDHDLAYSIYFADPDGNPLEVTTYHHEFVRASLG